MSLLIRKEVIDMADSKVEYPAPDCLAPAAIEAKTEAAGVTKANLPVAKAFLLAMFAGAFIAFGGLFFTVFLSDSTLGWGAQRVVGGLCFCLGLVLVLVCVSPLVQNLARWLMRLLPKTEKWQQRRADWQQQLDVLGEESRRLLADKPRCAEILALQAVKLFGLCCLPYLCIRFMGLSPLSFLQVQLLTSLMLFLSNALPNVAGMGSIETAFLLVFGSFLERGEVMSVMMLYRIASYYVVFAASAVGFFFAQRHLGQMGAELPKEA